MAHYYRPHLGETAMTAVVAAYDEAIEQGLLAEWVRTVRPSDDATLMLFGPRSAEEMSAEVMPLAGELGLLAPGAPDVTLLPAATVSAEQIAREGDMLLSRRVATGPLAALPRIESARDFMTERLTRRRRGVFVVGMHRSGTSAMARIVNILGVPLGAEDDLLPAGPGNPTGFWESRTAVHMNALLIRALGGAVFDPPSPALGWETDPRLAQARWEAREHLTAAFEGAQWAIKDPRLCFTLPFWRTALDTDAVVVMPFRNPLEVARSLEVRDGLPQERALSLWEHYVRASLAAADGMPLSVHSFGDLVENPGEHVERLRAFLLAHGFTLGDSSDAETMEIEAFLKRELRHHRNDDEELRGTASAAQVALYDQLMELSRAPAAAPRPAPGQPVASP